MWVFQMPSTVDNSTMGHFVHKLAWTLTRGTTRSHPIIFTKCSFTKQKPTKVEMISLNQYNLPVTLQILLQSSLAYTNTTYLIDQTGLPCTYQTRLSSTSSMIFSNQIRSLKNRCINWDRITSTKAVSQCGKNLPVIDLPRSGKYLIFQSE